MRADSKRVLIAFVIVASCGSLAFADVAATVVGSFQSGYPTGNDVGYSRGWRFWADEGITITHLGILDWGGLGLTGSHKVGLWRLNEPDSGATLLRSVDISGTVGMFSDSYRYMEISPITLAADPLHEQARYLVGYWTESNGQPADGLIVRPTGAIAVTSAITIQNQLGRYTETFDFPWSPTSDYDHFGVNFMYVPVPSAAILAALGLSAAGVKLRRRRG
jgi:hypothetical protein